MDRIYDHPYKESKGNKDYCRFRVRALALTHAILAGFCCEDDNILEWSTAFVRLGSPGSSAEIDRLDGDSKFFRSLTVVLILSWPAYAISRYPGCVRAWLTLLALAPIIFLFGYIKLRRKSSAYKELQEKKEKAVKDCQFNSQQDARGELEKLAASKPDQQKGDKSSLVGFLRSVMGTPAANAGSAITGFAWMTNDASAIIGKMFEKQADAEAAWNGEIAAPFRVVTFWAMAAWVVLMIATAAFVPIGRLVVWRMIGGGLYAALTLFAAVRYMELRLKRTELTYRSVIAIAMAPHQSILTSPNALERNG